MVIVPLLILWLGYGEREATGTSLADAVPERALEVSFAMLQLFVAFQLARRALRNDGEEIA